MARPFLFAPVRRAACAAAVALAVAGSRRRRRGIGAQRLRAAAGARRGAAARRSAADAAAADASASSADAETIARATPAAATPTTRCGRRPRWRSPPIASTGSRPIARSACELLDTLRAALSVQLAGRRGARAAAPPCARRRRRSGRRLRHASPAAARPPPRTCHPPPAPLSTAPRRARRRSVDRGVSPAAAADRDRVPTGADAAGDGRATGRLATLRGRAADHDRRHDPADARFRWRGRLRPAAAARAGSRLLRLRAHGADRRRCPIPCCSSKARRCAGCGSAGRARTSRAWRSIWTASPATASSRSTIRSG